MYGSSQQSVAELLDLSIRAVAASSQVILLAAPLSAFQTTFSEGVHEGFTFGPEPHLCLLHFRQTSVAPKVNLHIDCCISDRHQLHMIVHCFASNIMQTPVTAQDCRTKMLSCHEVIKSGCQSSACH